MARKKAKAKAKKIPAPALVFERKKLKRTHKDSIIVEGQDMGTANYAVTHIEAWLKDGRFRFRIIGTKMMQNMIHDVTAAQNESALYLAEYRQLPKADHIAAERYQSRPGSTAGGSTCEAISMMLGLMILVHPDTPIQFYTAATWKNAFNRTIADLKEMYADLAAKKYGDTIVIHQLDSLLIALYHAAKILGVTPFDFIEALSDEERIFLILQDAPSL